MKKQILILNKNQFYTAVVAVSFIISNIGMLLFFQSCGNDNKVTEPIEHVVDVFYLNQTDLANVSEALEKSRDPYKYIYWKFAPGVCIPFPAGDFIKINQLLELLNLVPQKVSFAANDAMLAPTENINLTDAQCDVLLALWKQGVQFTIGPSGAFWIIAAQASKFTTEMQQSLLFSDARTINITHDGEISQKCEEARDYADHQRVMLTVGPGIFNADSLVHLRKTWLDGEIHPNISVFFNSGTKAEVKRHPTEPYVPNSITGAKGEMDFVIHKNPNALGGYNALCINDTTPGNIRTLATAGKNPGTYIANTVDVNGKPINPIVATYWRGQSTYDSTGQLLSEDGVKMVPFNVKNICAGIYGNENGSYYILTASLIEACDGSSPTGDVSRLLYSWHMNEEVNFSVTKNPKYIGSASWDGKTITGTRIAYRDFYIFLGQPLGMLYYRPAPHYPSKAEQIKINLEAGEYPLLVNDQRTETGWSEIAQIGGTYELAPVNTKRAMGSELNVDGCTFFPIWYTGTIPLNINYVDLGVSDIPMNDGTMARVATTPAAR